MSDNQIERRAAGHRRHETERGCIRPSRARFSSRRLLRTQRQTLHQYAAATWQSFVALTEPSGLPADHINAAGERATYTSPTNIGAYLWSTLVARDLHLITAAEACARLSQTLQTLAHLDRHEPSGQFYNWYAPTTGA